MTQREFLNGLRILHSLDHHEVAFLSDESWLRFRDDPVGFLLRADDETVDAIWRAFEPRWTRRAV